MGEPRQCQRIDTQTHCIHSHTHIICDFTHSFESRFHWQKIARHSCDIQLNIRNCPGYFWYHQSTRLRYTYSNRICVFVHIFTQVSIDMNTTQRRVNTNLIGLKWKFNFLSNDGTITSNSIYLIRVYPIYI